MNRILRFSFAVALALVSSLSFAQTTVTFVAGTDNGKLSDSNSSGADQVVKDGITIATTNGLFAASNYSTKQGEYRTYKGSTFTVSSTVGNITKVVITCTANGAAKYGPGCFATPNTGDYTFEEDGAVGTWTGNAASLSMTASSNQVRATKVEVTYTPGAVTPTPDTPTTTTDTLTLSVSDAIDSVTNNADFKETVYVYGKVSQIDEVSTEYGNATYYISVDGTTTNQLLVYRGKFLGNEKFTDASQIKVGDQVKVVGQLLLYKGKNNSTIELTNSYLSEINNITAGISTAVQTSQTEAALYNLAGQRVNSNYKGVVIKNGKKYMNK